MKVINKRAYTVSSIDRVVELRVKVLLDSTHGAFHEPVDIMNVIAQNSYVQEVELIGDVPNLGVANIDTRERDESGIFDKQVSGYSGSDMGIFEDFEGMDSGIDTTPGEVPETQYVAVAYKAGDLESPQYISEPFTHLRDAVAEWKKNQGYARNEIELLIDGKRTGVVIID